MAWQAIEFAPILVGDLTRASASYRTPNGLVSAAWSTNGSRLQYDVLVPVGSTGTVLLNGSAVTEGGAPPAGQPGVLRVAVSGTVTTVLVGSGAYSFAFGLTRSEEEKGGEGNGGEERRGEGGAE